MTKKQLRETALAMRDAIPEKERGEWSLDIWRQLKIMDPFQRATHVLSYVSFRSEVDTALVHEYCLQKGKHLYLPKTNPVSHTMDFFEVTDMSSLVSGYQGILEPDGEKVFEPDKKEGSCYIIMLMPGVAFDAAGSRIGYGGGYYDRYLERHRFYIDKTIMLAFRGQCVDTIPKEECDISPQMILTNRR